MSYPIPRHWEFDRPVTLEEWAGPHGVVCMDCDVRITSFDMLGRRLSDESMLEIAFNDDDFIPVFESVCAKCAEKA